MMAIPLHSPGFGFRGSSKNRDPEIGRTKPSPLHCARLVPNKQVIRHHDVPGFQVARLAHHGGEKSTSCFQLRLLQISQSQTSVIRLGRHIGPPLFFGIIERQKQLLFLIGREHRNQSIRRRHSRLGRPVRFRRLDCRKDLACQSPRFVGFGKTHTHSTSEDQQRRCNTIHAST